MRFQLRLRRLAMTTLSYSETVPAIAQIRWCDGSDQPAARLEARPTPVVTCKCRSDLTPDLSRARGVSSFEAAAHHGGWLHETIQEKRDAKDHDRRGRRRPGLTGRHSARQCTGVLSERFGQRAHPRWIQH